MDPTAIRERKGKRLEDVNNVLLISTKCLCWLHITGRERTSWGNWIDRIKRTAWTKGLEKKLLQHNMRSKDIHMYSDGVLMSKKFLPFLTTCTCLLYMYKPN